MDSDFNCMRCPAKCGWEVHFNRPYVVEYYFVDVQVIENSKKLRHDAHKLGLTNAEVLQQKFQKKLKTAEEKLESLVKQARDSLQLLGDLSLKQYNYSYSAYLELLVQNEVDNKHPGFQRRLASLRVLLKKQKHMELAAAKIKKPSRQAAKAEAASACTEPSHMDGVVPTKEKPSLMSSLLTLINPFKSVSAVSGAQMEHTATSADLGQAADKPQAKKRKAANCFDADEEVDRSYDACSVKRHRTTPDKR